MNLVRPLRVDADMAVMPFNPAAPLVEGVDFYYENGLMVLTSAYLLRRGYCCDNGCRHCPYKSSQPSALSIQPSTSHEVDG